MNDETEKIARLIEEKEGGIILLLSISCLVIVLGIFMLFRA